MRHFHIFEFVMGQFFCWAYIISHYLKTIKTFFRVVLTQGTLLPTPLSDIEIYTDSGPRPALGLIFCHIS